MDYKEKVIALLNSEELSKEQKEKLEAIFPELKESEYERTRKEIINFLGMPHPQFVGKRDHEKWLAWLEKQKNTPDKEYVYRPLAGDTIEKAAERAVELDGEVVLAFNGAYIPVGNKTKDEIVAEYSNWVKKQSEQTSLQTNERAWLYLVSDVLTWKDGIGQYLDDPRVQELAKKLCSEYAQKLYNPLVLSNSSNIKNDGQKPVDKVEPKFKVGDWISGYYTNYKVTAINSKGYVVEDIDGNKINILFENEKFHHLWAIQDAKDGDVLVASDGSIFLFAGVDDCACKYHVALTTDNYVKINKDSKGGYWEASIAVYPATKEQRDLLFQKMTEVGYKFDFEKKELKTIEQNPADNVEPKFHEGEWLCENEPNNYARFIQILETVNVQGKERYRISRDIHNDEDIVEFSFVEKYYHKFDIADAKNGDVISYKGEISLYKHDIKNCTKQETTFGGFVYYCCYDGKRFITDSLYSLTEQDKMDIHPATKEQRDLLFAKMKEAGYEWDAEKKELKKIESKTLDATKVVEWLKTNVYDDSAYGMAMIEHFKKDCEI